ncbi:MAG UNVERIFIED_CONTAM: hypothetical protein LVR18_36020 [Planctomycetaceae bacterium]
MSRWVQSEKRLPVSLTPFRHPSFTLPAPPLAGKSAPFGGSLRAVEKSWHHSRPLADCNAAVPPKVDDGDSSSNFPDVSKFGAREDAFSMPYWAYSSDQLHPYCLRNTFPCPAFAFAAHDRYRTDF